MGKLKVTLKLEGPDSSNGHLELAVFRRKSGISSICSTKTRKREVRMELRSTLFICLIPALRP